MERNRKSSGPVSGGGASGTRMREVACPTCTVHLQVSCQAVHNTTSQILLVIFLLVRGELSIKCICVPFGCVTSGSGPNIWLRDSGVRSVPACLPCQRQLIRRETAHAIEIILLIIWLLFLLYT
jgi:hypothetical protein